MHNGWADLPSRNQWRCNILTSVTVRQDGCGGRSLMRSSMAYNAKLVGGLPPWRVGGGGVCSGWTSHLRKEPFHQGHQKFVLQKSARIILSEFCKLKKLITQSENEVLTHFHQCYGNSSLIRHIYAYSCIDMVGLAFVLRHHPDLA
jgi:hypothetical protein